MASSDEETTFFEKISNAFKTAIKGVSDLLDYFKHIIERCVDAIAILILKTFVVPLLILMLFRWLLKELFSLNIPDSRLILDTMRSKIKKHENKKELTITKLEENE